jgi:hypothetical protein
MQFMKILLMSLMFISIAAAQGADFTPLIPITAVTVVIFLAILNMLGTAIQSPQVNAWVKTELRELLAGVILVVIIMTFFITSRGITSAITGTGDYINASADIIENIITNKSVGYDRAFEDVIKSGSKVRVVASYAPYISLPIAFLGISIVYSEAPLAGVSPLLSSLAAATQGLANNILLFEAVLLMLKLAQTSIPAVVLPLGLSLRLFPLTRSLGNSVIAVCIAVMVFLPFSVILVNAMHGAIDYPEASLSKWEVLRLDFMLDYGGQGALLAGEVLCGFKPFRTILSLNEVGMGLIVCTPLIFIPPFGTHFINCFGIPTLLGLQGGWMTGIVYPMITEWTQYIYTFIVMGSLVATQVQAVAGIGYASRAFDILYPFLTQVNNLIVLGYIDILIMAVVTITGARSVSAALGGELYMAGIQRLI